MTKYGLEITGTEEKGYSTATRFDSWRIGIINWGESIDGEPKKIERHLKTDEAFILSTGKAYLFIGKELEKTEILPGRVYVVKKCEWHSLILEKGAKVFVIENADTDDINTERIFFNV